MENLPDGPADTAKHNQEDEESKDTTNPAEVPDVFIYREDVVSLKSKEGAPGLVLEVAGEYDSEGSITDDEDGTDTEEHGHKNVPEAEKACTDGDNTSNGAEVVSQSSLPDNKVRVLWIDGSEKTEDIDAVVVVDRSFLHGDLVASASDPTGQMGLVVDVNLVVDLQVANGDMIKGVSSKDLRRIRKFNVGDYVVSGPWLGRVDEVLDNVNVLFDDGSVCKITRADPMCLTPASGPLHPDTACRFYPGQRVKATSSSVFKTSRWLSGLWKASRLEGTVTKVESAAVIVYWIASAHFATDQQPVPLEEQSPKDLTLLSCFSYANWQLTDWCLPSPNASSFADGTSIESSGTKGLNSDEHIVNKGGCSESTNLPSDNAESQAEDQKTEIDMNHRETDGDSHTDGLSMSDGDNSSVGKESQSGTGVSTIPKEGSQDNATHRKKIRKVFFKKDKKTKRRDGSFERALLIVNSHTKVDVIWQDGTKECGVTSTSFIPIRSPNDHEFFPEQYVVDKVSNDVDDSSEPKRVGLVKSVNAKDQTASVSWFKPSLHLEEPREIECNEIVSAYELDGHPDYDYSYGDVVVRLPSVSHPVESRSSENKIELDKNVDSSEGLATSESEVAPPDVSAGDQFAQKDSSAVFTSLSWAGNIVGFQDGKIEVIWGDGSKSKVVHNSHRCTL
jgi:ubiquitin-conjugating enzyme E2 O